MQRMSGFPLGKFKSCTDNNLECRCLKSREGWMGIRESLKQSKRELPDSYRISKRCESGA